MIHILIAVYLIVALGTICDDFFVPVLEIICDKLNLKPDVAGATFMAAGKIIEKKPSFIIMIIIRSKTLTKIFK